MPNPPLTTRPVASILDLAREQENARASREGGRTYTAHIGRAPRTIPTARLGAVEQGGSSHGRGLLSVRASER